MNVAIIMPVFEDWVSCRKLLGDISRLEFPGNPSVKAVIVNDGSIQEPPEDLCSQIAGEAIDAVELVDLSCNLGHQRAIALGICSVTEKGEADRIVVMDSDGEDKPEDIPRLLSELEADPSAIVVAGRAQRSEGLIFRLGYCVYRLFFWLMTGKTINFGNFTAFSRATGERLSHMSAVWSHIAAAMLRSRLPIKTVFTKRGTRYDGKSRLGFQALVTHGFSAFSVFSESIFARLFVFSCFLAFLMLAGIFIVVGIRLFTDMAIPGWASTSVLVFCVVFLQAVLLCLLGSLQLHASRGQISSIPRAMGETFIKNTKTLFSR